MSDDEPKSDIGSSAVAIFAMIVLGGLLAVPIMFIVYGAGGGLGGLMVLGVLIVCQLVVFAFGQLVLGFVTAIASRIKQMFVRHRE
jgi:hypothetical protein